MQGNSMRSRLPLAFATCFLTSGLMASSISAQDADVDWDYVETSPRMAQASVEFGGGVLVAVQCQAEQLNVIIGGVPNSGEPTRSVLITRADGQSRQMELSAVEGSDLLRSWRAPDARFLRAGGQTTMASLPEDTHPFRMEVPLPTQKAGVDNVLTACGYSLADDRDSLTDVSDLVARAPLFDTPRLPRRYTRVTVELSCLVSEGRLAACRSEHETPIAPEVGAATARLADGRRLALKEGADAEGGVLEIVVVGSSARR